MFKFPPLITAKNYLFNTATRKVILLLIGIYQRFISPYKGFSCAYRILYQQESCSCYVKKAFIENDISTALNLSIQRFNECSDASRTLSLSSNTTDQRVRFLMATVIGFSLPMYQTRFECCGDIASYSSSNSSSGGCCSNPISPPVCPDKASLIAWFWGFLAATIVGLLASRYANILIGGCLGTIGLLGLVSLITRLACFFVG
jgi:putative component of membrane protein insertase Oxa1/YidC/SpoIIIJ protein YidD